MQHINPTPPAPGLHADLHADLARQVQQRMDFSHWPALIVRMPSADQAPILFAMLEAALQRGQPFALVADMAEYLGGPPETPAQRKAAALWLKRHRQAFFSLCRGNVYVLADERARAALLASGRQQASASGLPIEAAATLEEALAMARQLLNKATPQPPQTPRKQKITKCEQKMFISEPNIRTNK
ncbi:hypothetical protein EBQ34_11630 [Vandammella animalimorsus]|uniref:Uncharacterized protein n=1 Tax=Vandammella animalimorsus TaxID=2029117 RepID=A0A3M6R7E2_9BURK|nr:hypothetical protein [Vandammella animalimorsus]RMX10790.1 hypothetical protein EBQ34_11630 [Vandammella animalimorsus]